MPGEPNFEIVIYVRTISLDLHISQERPEADAGMNVTHHLYPRVHGLQEWHVKAWQETPSRMRELVNLEFMRLLRDPQVIKARKFDLVVILQQEFTSAGFERVPSAAEIAVKLDKVIAFKGYDPYLPHSRICKEVLAIHSFPLFRLILHHYYKDPKVRHLHISSSVILAVCMGPESDPSH